MCKNKAASVETPVLKNPAGECSRDSTVSPLHTLWTVAMVTLLKGSRFGEGMGCFMVLTLAKGLSSLDKRDDSSDLTSN